MAHLCKSSKECDHICIPLWNRDKAITKCLCASGYQLNQKNKCVKQVSQKFLLVAQNKPALIKGINISNKTDDVLSITGLKEPRHLDYNVQSNSIIYFDAGTKTINSVSLSSTNERKVLVEHIYCSGLAVDWIGRNLYYIDGTRRSLKVANLRNTTQVKTIISNIHNLPTSIAVDPKNGVLYLALWSDVSPMRGEIYTAYMNGSNFKAYINESIHWPIGLSINYETNRVFWCDQHKQTIESADFNGNNRVVMKIEIEQPSALALVDSNEFYVVSRTKGVIKHLKNNTVIDTINKTSSTIFDLKLFNGNAQRNFSNENPCNKCNEICLLAPNNTGICTCRDSYTLNGQYNCVIVPSSSPEMPCPSDHFKCKDEWRCISNNLACDGNKDCTDGSDEATTSGGRCEHFQCPKGSFQCDKTKCIPRNWICDSYKDCEDGTDEESEKCMTVMCRESEFQCNISKKCIPAVWKCDLSHDCGPGDFSDELDCGKIFTFILE